MEKELDDIETNELSFFHGRNFAELRLDLNRLEFGHHWLFSMEDCLACKMHCFYNEYLRNLKYIINFIRKYVENKQFSENGKISENK